MQTTYERKKNLHLFAIVAALFVSFAYGPAAPRYTIATGCDEEFYSSNDIIFYDPCEQTVQSCSTSASSSVLNNLDYAGNAIFNDAQIQEIETNRPFYEAAAQKEGIPWQLIAAIHGKENSFDRNGPANGYGPYQITPSQYPIKDSYSDEEFQDATDKAAANIKGRVGDRDLTDPENIKYVLFSYNGRSQAYITQAKNLGFTDEEASRGEGSPYVMNKFDQRRDPTVEPVKSNGTWGQIKTDYGSISYPANPGYGTFVFYSALANLSLCGSSASQNGDVDALQNEFATYARSHGNGYPPTGYTVRSNGCTTVSAWYIGEHTTLKYGRGNGEAVVRNLIRDNPGKGLIESNVPVAPAIFSVRGGARGIWGTTGNPAGHVGVVVSVDEEKKTAKVLHTGSSAAGIPKLSWTAEYSYPASGVTFVYVGDYLK